MKKSLLPFAASIFILLTCMAFMPEPILEKNNINNILTDIILELSEPQERISFEFEQGGTNQVTLCNLEIGITYDLYISDLGLQCPLAPTFLGKNNSAVKHLKITPSSACYSLTIQNHCNFKKEAILSVSREDIIDSNNNGTVQNDTEMIPITTNSSLTATELIEDVFIGGGCFDVTNVQTIGSSQGIGSFGNGGTSIGFDDGVVLSSGNITGVSGPNSGEGGANSTTGGGSDPDLAILTSQTINDAAGIEFDFSPTLSTIEFRFVFASDEYCEYVGTQFNDVFGFFISGPGFNGPFSGGGENIALVPTTTTPITINSVNNVTNTTYFLPNNAGCGGVTNSADIEFDGFTVILTATANVTPCETYHIRLVVGDGSDSAFDSAVFLEAGSFNAGGQASVTGGNATGSGVIYEDCDDGFITFTRETGDASLPLLITYNIDPASTATSGVDYAPIPTSITIPAGQTEVTIPITVFGDGIIEGIETIILEIDNSCSCINSSTTIEISDNVPLDVTGLDDQVLCGSQTLTFSPTIVGGIPPLTYSWSTGQTTPSITQTINSTTMVSVTITDDCGNTGIEDATITIGTPPTATLSGSAEICPPGNPAATLQVVFTGVGPWDLHYNLNGVAQTPITGITSNPYTLTVSELGTYTISQVIEDGCPGIGTGLGVITQTILAPVAVAFDVSCPGEIDGAINTIPVGGEAPYFYTWSNPSANGQQNPNNLPAGNYTVTVSDANGCTGVASTTINEPPPIIASAVGASVDCSNPNGGNLTLTVSGGTAPLGYMWSNGSTQQNPSGITSGTYTVTITDDEGCTTTAFAIVTEDFTPPTAVANVISNINCNSPQGSLDGSGSSVGNNFTYAWTTQNGSFISGQNSLSPIVGSGGTYQLVVTNTTNGCTELATVTVSDDSNPPNVVANAPSNIDCNNPQISLNGLGTSLGNEFSYQWTTGNGNIVSGGTSLNPLVDAAGTYTLTVINSDNGCVNVATVSITADLTLPQADAGQPQTLGCNSGNVTLIGALSSMGQGITYLWTTGNGVIVSGEGTLLPQVSAPGTYQLLVTNTANGCTAVDFVDVTLDNSAPNADAGDPMDLTCGTTQLDLDGSGSDSGPNITYMWTTQDGNITGDPTTLNPSINAAGTYQIAVTGANGCSTISTVIIGENQTEPNVDPGPMINIPCGATQVTLMGNTTTTGNVTYQWTTQNGNIVSGANTLNPIVDATGTYVLTIINNDNDCSNVASTEVTNTSVIPAVDAGADQELTCTMGQTTLDGSNSATGASITYQWTTGNGNIVSGDDTNNPTVDAAGTYTLLVTDTDSGCTATATVDVTETVGLPDAVANAQASLTCTVMQVALDGTGSSTGNFTYMWTTQNGNIVSGDNTLAPQVNAAGTYVLVVTNTATGCTQTASVDITNDGDVPDANAGTADDITCDNNTITLNGTGSSGANFTYQWTTGNGNIVSGDDSLNPNVNGVGTYQLLVTNTDNGCTSISLVDVGENIAPPEVTMDIPSSLDCNTSTINLTGTNNDPTGNYTYTWTTQNGDIVSGENTLNPTVGQEGQYNLEITNTDNGCTATTSVDVSIDNQEPVADAGSLMEVNCANVEINLDGSGSATVGNFTYEWTTQNGIIISGDDSLNPLVGAAGTYQILVTNLDNGCTAVSEVVVDEDFDDPVAVAGQTQTLSCSQTSLQLNGNGSSFGNEFTYVWTTQNGSIVSGDSTLTPAINAAGEYQLEVTNTDNGCVNTSTVTIEQDSNVPTSAAGDDDMLNCNITTLTLDGSNSSTGIEFSYEWTTQNGNIVSGENTINPLIDEPGEYQLVVTNNANGCTAPSSLTIGLDDTTPTSEAGISQSLSCTNNEVTLDGVGSSTGTEYTYQWVTQNGNIVSGENTLTPLVNATGTYELIVTFLVSGCTTSDFVDVNQDSSLPTADAGLGFEITCNVSDGTLDGSNSTIGNDITFAWTTQDGNIVSGDNTLTPIVDEAGVYQLTLTNITNGCTAISAVTVVANNNEPTAEAGITAELNCNDEMLTLSGTTMDTSSTLIYEWTTQDGNIVSGDNSLNPEINLEGTYQLMITNSATGCVSTDDVIITSDFIAPTADAGATDELNCTQAFATLDGNGSSTGLEYIYLWTTQNGNIVSGDNTLNPDVNMPGDYVLLVTNIVNGCTSTEVVNITENIDQPLVNIDVAADLTCDITSFELDGSASSAGTEFSYLWTTSDGNIVSGDDAVNPIIDEPGTYVFVVTNTTNNCTATSQIVVDENVIEPNSVAGAQGQLTCTVTQTQLDGSASSTGTEYAYLWTTTTGSIISGETTLFPTVGGTGTYELIVTNTITGCTSNSFTDVLSDGNLPDVAAAPMGVLTCTETSITLSGIGSSTGANFTYAWTTMNGNIVSGSSSISPTVDQTGDYTLLVTNITNGCSDAITITVNEDIATPTAVIDQTGSTSLDCMNSSLTLDGSGSQPFGNVSYAWTTVNGNIVSGANTANPEIDDDGDYVLTITNLTNGCTETQSITIDQDLSVPQVQVAPPTMLTCDITELTLDGTGSSVGTNYSYQWTTSNGNIVSGATTLNPIINQPGEYELTVVDLNSNCDNDFSITVLENVLAPDAEAGVANMLDCQVTSVSLNGSASSFGNNITYTWTTTNGNIVSGATTISPVVDAVGTYTLLVTDTQNGCTATDAVIVDEDASTPSGIIYTIDEPECHGDAGSIVIETVDGGTPPYLYSIDGDNFYSGHIFTLDAGDYTLYAQDASGCETQTSFIIPELDPVNILLENEVTIELGDNYQIEATTNIPADEIESIRWNPDLHLSASDILNPVVENLLEDLTYTLTITTIYGCKVEAKITVHVDKSRAIYIPNAFNPNSENGNDIFMIYAGDLNQIKQVNSFLIFDRWGEVVHRAENFMPMDPDYGWNGTLKGKTLNPQVFVYWAEIEFIDGIKIMYKGDVALRK